MFFYRDIKLFVWFKRVLEDIKEGSVFFGRSLSFWLYKDIFELERLGSVKE